MKPIFTFWVVGLITLSCSEASASVVVSTFSSNASVYAVFESGEMRQLTSGEVDEGPVLSPAGDVIVFVRKSTNYSPVLVGDDSDVADASELLADQVWLYDLRLNEERILLDDVAWHEDGSKEFPEDFHQRIDWQSLCFNADGNRLYFLSEAWATSSALHEIRLPDGEHRYVMPAHTVQVVPSGEYRNHLIVSQHRYFLGAGSYDWWWLFAPDGTEIGPVGDTAEHIESFLEIHAAE